MNSINLQLTGTGLIWYRCRETEGDEISTLCDPFEVRSEKLKRDKVFRLLVTDKIVLSCAWERGE